MSSTPELMINKDRDAAADWIVYTTAIDGSLDVLRLNLTNSAVNSGATAPTSTVFESFIQNGNNVVTYCFHSVAGYSKIGSYTGTGAAGNSINLGFKPAFLLIKETGNANSWELFDNTRNTSSPFDKRLFPNDTAAEATTTSLSYSDTGFETLNGNTGINRSGGTYLYYAVADTREAAFWKDVSGENSNNWTPNNLDYRDSVFDSPANNFAVMNALEPSSGVSATLSEGNLKTVGTTVTYSGGIASTFEQSSGKWYWEVYVNSEVTAGSNFYNFVGAATGDNNLIHNSNNSQIPSVVAGINGWSWEGDGTINLNGTGTTAVSSVTAPNAGDVLGFAIDLDNGNVYFYHNGTAQNSGSAVITGVTGLTHNPMVGVYNGSTVTFNFGQDSTFAGAKAAGAYTDSNNTGSFAYEPPSDYLALCTANLPTPAITDGSAAFNTVLYTGDGTSNKSVTGTGHAPDFLWFKKRSGAESHHLGDTIRGASKRLVSNTTAAETTESGLVSFDSDGFTISGASGGSTNDSGATYAAWSWKAGGTAVSNTDGSITSQVSANVDAGFSIVSYTGTRTSDAGETGTPTTIGHGLGKKPTVVITKARTSTTNMRWNVWHQGYQPDQTYLNYQLWLNTTDQSNNAGWQRTDTGFSTTTFCPARYSWDDVLGVDYISYVFADVEGYQKAGSYTGNGSADGPFVYTGFRPAWLMVKRADTAADWIIWDDKRNTYNELTKFLYPNLSVAEATGSGVADLLSNGFKLRNAGTANRNASGGTYIYLAFAEVPFKVANAR